ncbi:transcriptional regulator [Enterococcus faecium]|nr:transcriptional regulator [Enterococcus faecium]
MESSSNPHAAIAAAKLSFSSLLSSLNLILGGTFWYLFVQIKENYLYSCNASN